MTARKAFLVVRRHLKPQELTASQLDDRSLLGGDDGAAARRAAEEARRIRLAGGDPVVLYSRRDGYAVKNRRD